MAKYMTKQRKTLLAHLQAHADETFSASQILEALADETISVSAIYRNLADLEQEGKLKRTTRTGSQEVCYRYTDAEKCRGHLHLSCERCGKTFHMEQRDADMLADKLEKAEGFALNRSDTVLYGLCSECQQ